MKKLILLALLIIATISAQSQITLTATSGTASGSYATLKGAFDAINAGTHMGAIVISVNASTIETASATLNVSSGTANYTSVLIRPTTTDLSISGSIAGAPLIFLNGATNVTIDGRVNGTGSTKSLIISNTSTSNTTGTATIKMDNTALNHLVEYCILKGSATVGAGNGTSGI
ncbi:MAG: hypothetical protein NTY72_14215, partial [Bacteroidetes bacterium]|nr:hypothetical protein [Bacteroidota bacterium]